MHISTTARHFELDPEDRAHAVERVEKLTRFAKDLSEAHVVLTAEGYRHSAEITLKLRRQEMISREESTDVRTAIDLATEHLERQLLRLKEKRVSRKRGVGRNGKGIPAPAEQAESQDEWTEEA